MDVFEMERKIIEILKTDTLDDLGIFKELVGVETIDELNSVDIDILTPAFTFYLDSRLRAAWRNPADTWRSALGAAEQINEDE